MNTVWHAHHQRTAKRVRTAHALIDTFEVYNRGTEENEFLPAWRHARLCMTGPYPDLQVFRVKAIKLRNTREEAAYIECDACCRKLDKLRARVLFKTEEDL